jgi:CRISPR-associated protein Csc3
MKTVTALTTMATLAAQARPQIKGRSYKRNSLLKPLDIILDFLEREPREALREVVRKAAEREIFDHVYNVIEAQFRPGLTKQRHLQDVIHEYVMLFFEEILNDAYKRDVNRLLRNKRMLRSAYLIDYRDALSPSEKEQADEEQYQEADQSAQETDE